MEKRLYRSNTNKVFAGILGGLGEYFDIDPTLFRLLFLFILIFTAIIPGIFFYLLAMLVIPSKR